MKIQESKITKIKLTDLDRLDLVNVLLDDLSPGVGRIIIECYGKAWTSYWGAMGDDRTIAEFFCDCNNDYILGKMLSETRQTDFDKIGELAKEKGFNICATNDVELAMLSDEMADCFGGDWYMYLPRCRTSDYVYLSRIIDAVKESLAKHFKI